MEHFLREKIDSLPSLKELLMQHNLWAKKSLGQNFLLNPAVTDHIAHSAHIGGKIVLEIGPGPGGLTRSLLRLGAKKVIAVEKDPRCLSLLKSLFDVAEGRLILLEKDALNLSMEDLLPLAEGDEMHVVANLPYNIGTELLVRWLHDIAHFPTMTLMFQREVAKRIVAQPDTSAYGRLAILVQSLCSGNILFDLDPASFTPPPKVTSSVVRLSRRNNFEDILPIIPTLEKITHAAFGQRRKMLRSSLKIFFTSDQLAALGLDPTLRAEVLTLEQFHMLADTLGENL